MKNNICYISDPYFIEGNNEWSLQQFGNTSFDVFLTPYNGYCGGGVNLHACYSQISQAQKYREFLRAFDYAANGNLDVYNPETNETNEQTEQFAFINGNVAFNFWPSNEFFDQYKGWQYCIDCAGVFMARNFTPCGELHRERMCGQVDFVSLGMYRDLTNFNVACIALEDVPETCGYTDLYYTRSFVACDDRFCQCVGGELFPFNSSINNVGWVWETCLTRQCITMWLGYNSYMTTQLVGRTNYVNNTIFRDPCETDGVLYVGMPNFDIASLPIKRIKCTLDVTPNISVLQNGGYSFLYANRNAFALHTNESVMKYCFITFPKICNDNYETLIINNAVFAYLCDYKNGTGTYVALCKNSLNLVQRETSNKMSYYTFQAYSVSKTILCQNI